MDQGKMWHLNRWTLVPRKSIGEFLSRKHLPLYWKICFPSTHRKTLKFPLKDSQMRQWKLSRGWRKMAVECRCPTVPRRPGGGEERRCSSAIHNTTIIWGWMLFYTLSLLRGLGGTQSWSWYFGEEKNSFLLLGIESWHLCHQACNSQNHWALDSSHHPVF
jgi:hypothetical protein